MYWLIGRKSQLSNKNKILLYKSIIKYESMKLQL